MIEVIGTRSGDRTLSFNGKLLASKFDPRLEAERWSEKNKSELIGIKTAIIIGAGAAYHLSVIQKMYPHLKIICIEFNKDIIQQVRNSIEISLLGVEIIYAESIENIFDNKDIRIGLASSYKVIVHPSSLIHSPELTKEASLELCGRLDFGFHELLKIRGFQAHESSSNSNDDSYFSIHDIAEVYKNDVQKDPRVFDAVKELLK